MVSSHWKKAKFVHFYRGNIIWALKHFYINFDGKNWYKLSVWSIICVSRLRTITVANVLKYRWKWIEREKWRDGKLPNFHQWCKIEFICKKWLYCNNESLVQSCSVSVTKWNSQSVQKWRDAKRLTVATTWPPKL
jgi:hypothetical protein